MAMQDAFRFLTRCRQDAEFRKSAYFCNSPQDLFQWLKTSGFSFTLEEADDALRSLQLKSADETEADEIKELGQWFHIMAQRPAVSPCHSCAKKSE